MSEKIRKQRTVVTKNTRTEVIDRDTRTRTDVEAAALKAELDAELAAIDDILEEVLRDGAEVRGKGVHQAQAFIDAYVQRGGE